MAVHGSDFYFVDNIGDVVIENANDGNDTVYASFDYRLGANVEYLVLQGSAVGRLRQQFVERDRRQPWQRQSARRRHPAPMRCIGGAGSDSYFVDNSGDVVIENANDGNDAVCASIAHYRLAAERRVPVAARRCRLQGYGNSSSNAIVGNTGNNLLNGEGGADSMYGGAGNDVYFVDDAGDVVIENVNEGNDTVYASIDYGLTANVDNLILQGSANLQAYGNNGVNALFGNSGNNILNGEGGADHMFGGAGNDVYVVDNVGDLVVEAVGAGNDTVYASVNYALTANVDNPDPARGQCAPCRPTGNSGVKCDLRQLREAIRLMAAAVPTSSSVVRATTRSCSTSGKPMATPSSTSRATAPAGRSLNFVGFGTAAQGATLTQIGATHWQINYNGGSSHESASRSRTVPRPITATGTSCEPATVR